MNLTRPSATFMERVALPTRVALGPTSGLDSLLEVLAPTLLSAVTGLHGVGEVLDATRHITATGTLQAATLEKEEHGPRAPMVAQNAPTPSLSLTAPLELTLVDVPVRRDVDVLDPRLQATDPTLAARYQPRPSTLEEAFRRFTRSSEAVTAANIKESVPWRIRR